MKRIVCLFLMLNVLIGSFAAAVFAAEELKEYDVSVLFRQIIQLPAVSSEDEIQLLEKAIEAAHISKWTYNQTENRLERIVAYPDIEVSLSNQTGRTNEAGKVSFLAEEKIDVLHLKVYDPTTKKTYAQKLSSDSTEIPVIIDLDISKMFIGDDIENPKGSSVVPMASPTDPYWSEGEKGNYGDRLHCNRFNGWEGDGCYYSGGTPSSALKAAINFAGSDCDWSLGSYPYCLKDYTSDPYCAASPSSKQGKCSGLIGHYNRFHMHTTWSGD